MDLEIKNISVCCCFEVVDIYNSLIVFIGSGNSLRSKAATRSLESVIHILLRKGSRRFLLNTNVFWLQVDLLLNRKPRR
jgi:hypothetical protein